MAEQASRPPSVKSIRSASEEVPDSLFDGLSPATATPPSSFDLAYEDEKPYINGNGKRSRQSPAGASAAPVVLDLEPTAEGQSDWKRPKRETESPGALPAPVAAAEDSEDDGDFEEVA